jgi:hypothetical protein
MTIQTIPFKPERLSPKECKVCGEVATRISYDVKGNDVGPSVYHCQACTADARPTARFFISLPKRKIVAPGRSIEDYL